MKRYLRYRKVLDDLLEASAWGNVKNGLNERFHASLNGGAAMALRDSVPGGTIRRYGAYFTGEHLARQAIRPLAEQVNLQRRPVCDPTCGSGDLLLRWAEHLPVSKNLDDTLEDWQRLLFGIDLHSEFLAVAKRRFALLAISRGARYKGRAKLPLDRFFPGLVVDNILQSQDNLPGESSLIMNPPFTHGPAPRGCNWASGRVSHAAVAFLKCIDAASPGRSIVAILPDVLRSGRRYQRWRMELATRMSEVQVDVVGRFDNFADVDVFILRGTIGNGGQHIVDWKSGIQPGRVNLGTICTVHVGAVVPHRDENIGPWHPYVTVHDLPAWKEVSDHFPSRRHWAAGVRPPFVAVRRTSSPQDAERAIGTIVRGATPVIAENHLITLRPNDRRVATCHQILRTLQDRRTLAWLNKRIRCRHLTVGAVKEIPLLA